MLQNERKKAHSREIYAWEKNKRKSKHTSIQRRQRKLIRAVVVKAVGSVSGKHAAKKDIPEIYVWEKNKTNPSTHQYSVDREN